MLGDGNTIGGTEPADRNLISGNGSWGVRLNAADSNLVQGNIIGLDAAGMNTIPNVRDGISDFNGSSNTFGGDALGAAAAWYGTGYLLPFFRHPMEGTAMSINPDATVFAVTGLSAVLSEYGVSQNLRGEIRILLHFTRMSNYRLP